MTTSAGSLNRTEPTFSYAAAASGKNSTTTVSNKPTPPKPSTAALATPAPMSSAVAQAAAPNGAPNGTTAITAASSVSGSESHTKVIKEVTPPHSTARSDKSASASIIQKEDAPASTTLSVPEDKTNAWEKHSQTSENMSTTGSRASENSKNGGDLVPAAAPPVNFWKQRQEAAAKAKTTPTPAVNSMATVQAPAASDNAVVDKFVEQKQGGRKKGQNSSSSSSPEKAKLEEGTSALVEKKEGTGKDFKDLKDRKKSMDGTKLNGFVSKDDGIVSTKQGKSGKKGHQHEKESTTPAPPPPVTDSTSWPTPDIAKDETDKPKKDSEEKEKEKPARGNKWVSVQITTPYVPPFPSKTGRGGRSNRGGREGGGRVSSASSSNQSGEKPVGVVSGPVASENDHGRQGTGVSVSRGGYQGGKSVKRSTSPGGSTPRRETKPTTPTTSAEKKKEMVSESGVNSSVPSPATTQNDGQRQGPNGTSKDAAETAFIGQGEVRQHLDNQEKPRQNGHSFQTRSERGPNHSFGVGKSDGLGNDSHSPHPPRERGSERGRGHRGRGGYHSHFSNSHHNANHHQNLAASQYSSPQHQYQNYGNGQQFSQHQQPQQRMYRGSPRSQSVAHNPMYRYHQTNQLQPYIQPYQMPQDYSMIVPPVIQPTNDYLINDITVQINYYFSVDNLCKDMFLRKHMDSHGFVRLSTISAFNRIKNLTQDPNIIQEACIRSGEVQLQAGVDDWHIRKASGWENWILNEEDRDPVARCDPSNWQYDHRQGQSFSKNISVSPLEMSGSAEPFMPDTRKTRSLGTIVPNAPAFVPGYQQAPVGVNNATTPLSANVPEFSPNPVVNGIKPLATDDFIDAEIDKLIIVCRRIVGGDNGTESPDASPSRPSSNGTVDGKDTMNYEENLRTNGLTNGGGDSPGHVNLSSSNGPSSPGRKYGVGWFMSPKLPQETPVETPLIHRSYGHFRTQALKQREMLGAAKNSDMVTLYKFWSHFLTKRYNGSMYREFKTFALEDANVFSRVGLDYLFKFYEASIKLRDTMGNDLIRDFVILAKKDSRNGHSLGLDKINSLLVDPTVKVQYKKGIEDLLDAEIRRSMEVGVDKMKDGKLVESYTEGIIAA